MASFVDEFIKSYGSQVSKQVASKLGIKSSAALQIIPQVVPLILGGLQKQKEQFGGEARVDHILNKYGSADVLSNIGSAISSRMADDSVDASLGGLLGNSGLQATDMIASKFKLDASAAAKIIPVLAPFILGALSNKRDSGAGISGIGALLDQDGDGSILDDVAGFLMGGKSSSSSSGGNILGSLLGGLFKKK